MQKNCRQCAASFQVTPWKLRLYEKFDAKPDGLCFDCQQKNRLLFRNERVLYKRKCDATGKEIVSIYAPDSPYTVYNNEYWNGDKWDALSYGREYDFNKTFFEQFAELHKVVPRSPLVNMRSENSDYCNMCIGNKDCYLVFGGDFNDGCMYGTLCMHNRDCLDIDYSNGSELCYMMDNSMDCYGCSFTWDSKNCNDCHFVTDCIGCSECIMCSNLNNKSYHIDNKPYAKEEYLRKKKEILSGSREKQLGNWEKFKEMRSHRIVKFGHVIACENCSGDYLKNSKNCHNCFDVSDSEDINNCIFATKAKDCFNVSLIGDGTELIFNSIAIMEPSNVRGSYYVLGGANVEFCEQMVSSQDVLGCNGLKHKQYCILNKQYSRDDFLALRAKIVERMKKTTAAAGQAGEWDMFLPRELSCFAYNESTAMRYFPLTKEQALKEGFRWKEEDKKSYLPQTFKVPDNIRDVPESILDQILVCKTCGKNFKVIAAELKFYREQNIPVSENCPDCRQKERISLRNPLKVYECACAKCGAPVQTTYPPQSPESVYCESCYLKEVY